MICAKVVMIMLLLVVVAAGVVVVKDACLVTNDRCTMSATSEL